jgi:hypothetical protein
MAVLSAALLVGIPPARAETAARFWPEFDGFFSLSERTRLMLMASDMVTEEPDESGGSSKSRSAQVGANLDYTLIPVARPRLEAADWERDRYLWMRVGAMYLGSANGWSGGESRGVFELNARQPLGDGWWLTNRLKWDMRDINGDYSNRYRVRLGIEKELILVGRKWIPFADAEAFYDTRHDDWNREYYRAGVEVIVNDRWRIEPYLGYQYNSGSEPQHINVIGLTIKFTR